MLAGFIEEMKNDWNLSPKTAIAINLILDELVTNAIEHGITEPEIDIHISFELADDVITILMKYSGKPFDPTVCKKPDTTGPLLKRKCGGLGVHIVRTLSNYCCYQRNGNENILTIRKNLNKECG